MSASRVGQMVKRIPLIKFRYVKSLNGLHGDESSASEIQMTLEEIELPKASSNLSTGMGQPAFTSYNGVSSSSTNSAGKHSGPSIEFYQLPQKYRRAPISDYEMSIINNGGPE